MLKVMEKGASRELFELDEIALAGARRMLMAALKTEAADYVARHRPPPPPARSSRAA